MEGERNSSYLVKESKKKTYEKRAENYLADTLKYILLLDYLYVWFYILRELFLLKICYTIVWVLNPY